MVLSSPTLYRLAANREYAAIPSRAASHPQDIGWTDRYGSTCLHILCQARTNVDDASRLRAVRAIVQQRPEVVSWANVATWTPLHFAVERKQANHSAATATTAHDRQPRRTLFEAQALHQESDSAFTDDTDDTSSENGSTSSTSAASEETSPLQLSDHQERHHQSRLRKKKKNPDPHQLSTSTRLVLHLIEACPQAVSVRTKTGFQTKTPFHIACEADAEYCVLRAMLAVNPSLALQPYYSHSSYAAPAENPLQVLWKNHARYPRGSGKPKSHYNNSQILQDKMALLLRAAHLGTVHASARQTTFRLLNAICSVRCPKEYVALILKKHADQISQTDEDGLLPLHHAVQQAQAVAPDGGGGALSYTQFLVEALLAAYPEAASIPDPQSGRLPLHAAAAEGLLTWHKGGVQELTVAHPNALSTVDPVTQLVPFLQSAPHAIRSRLHLSTTMELLLAAPQMVQPRKQSLPQQRTAKK